MKPQQIYEPAGVKQTVCSHFFSSFELGSITKHLMTGPAENSEFCFPQILRASGKQNSPFPLGPVMLILLRNAHFNFLGDLISTLFSSSLGFLRCIAAHKMLLKIRCS